MDHDHGTGGGHGDMGHGDMGHGDMGHGDMGHGDMDMGHGGGSMHMMSMSFHCGYRETILFEWWKTTTQNELLLAVFIVGLVAALYEGIKYIRGGLLEASLLRRSSPALPDSTTALHRMPAAPGCAEAMFSWNHVIQTLLHAFQFTVSYMLMLVFMTYNVWLCLGVVVGATLGYFLFGWKRSTALVSIADHCH